MGSERKQIISHIRDGFVTGLLGDAVDLRSVHGKRLTAVWYRNRSADAYIVATGVASWDGDELRFARESYPFPNTVPKRHLSHIVSFPMALSEALVEVDYFVMGDYAEWFDREDEAYRDERHAQLRRALVRLFDLFDPEGVVTHHNPGEEYTPEVDRLMTILPNVSDVEALTVSIRAIFDEFFNGQSSLQPQDAATLASVASALWQKYREHVTETV